MRRGLAHSLALHTVIFLIVIFGLPHFGEDEVMKMSPIAVELVTPSDISSAPPKGVPKPEPAKPEPPKPEPPKPTPPETPKPEPPKPEPPKPEPPQPTPDDVPLPTPDAPKPQPEQKQPKPPKAKPTPPKVVQKQPDKKIPPKKNNFNNLLNDLADDKNSKKPPAKQGAEDAPEESPNISSALNMSEMDAVRNQVMGCWLEPTGLREGEKMVVEIRVVVNSDRTVQRAEIVDKARMRRDSFYRTLGESAIRALYNPRCSPLLLPPNKYNTWRVTTFRFSPGEIY